MDALGFNWQYDHFRMKVLLFFLGLLLSFSASAETLKLCTGEFEPYTGEHLPEQGISTVVVKKILEKAGYQVEIDFLPWRRAYANLKAGICQASFPWALNEERQKDVLYSEPLHKDQITFFVKRGSAEEKIKNWHGKALCIPSGWDLKQISKSIEKYKFEVRRPPELENCMRMVAMSRVDLTAVNQMVGNILIAKTFPETPSPVVQINEETSKDYTYFIVGKKYPKSQELIAKFNATLKKLIKDGDFDRMVIAAVEKQKSQR